MQAPVLTISIGELAKRTGLSTSAIRYYERHGLIPAPSRSGGQRRYDPEAVKHIQLIRAGKHFGFTLDEIRSLLQANTHHAQPSAYWRQLAEKKLPEVEAQIQQLQALQHLLTKGTQCACVSLDQCMTKL